MSDETKQGALSDWGPAGERLERVSRLTRERNEALERARVAEDRAEALREAIKASWGRGAHWADWTVLREALRADDESRGEEPR